MEYKKYSVSIEFPLNTPEDVAMYLALVRKEEMDKKRVQEILTRSLFGPRVTEK